MTVADAPEPVEPGGGESACFAHLVCEECGALEHEGHHDECSAVHRPVGDAG